MMKSGLVLNFYPYTLFYLQTAWKHVARFYLWHGYLQLTLKCRALQDKVVSLLAGANMISFDFI